MPTLAEVARRLKPRHLARPLPRLFLMTDSRRMPDPEAAVRALPRGSAVVLRETDPIRRAALARRLAMVCRACHVLLLISGDWRLAAACRADGVHLSEATVRHGGRTWRRARRPGALRTAAAHSPAAVRRAAALGVDAVLLAPVFPTPSHPHAAVIGALRFTRWAGASTLPVYALGGIDAATGRRLAASGAAGFAAIGALLPRAQSKPSEGSTGSPS